MDKCFLDGLYLLGATLQYNSERRFLLERVIKKYLDGKIDNLDIQHEFKKEIIISSADDLSLESLFAGQSHVLPNTIPTSDALEYSMKRYFRYNNIFKKKFSFDIRLIFEVQYLIINYLIEKSKMLKFEGQIYKFKNKQEFSNISLIKIPDKTYVRNWKNSITFDIKDLIEYMPGAIFDKSIESNIKKVLKFFSFDTSEIKPDINLRFQEKPLLRIGDKYLVITPYYLGRCLPQKYELLLRECKGYNELKGKDFEKMALELLKKVPNSKLYHNIRYSKFELDGLLNLKKSSWFVECSSHPPSINSLLGNLASIRDDLGKTIKKCEEQALRAIDNINHPNIAKLQPKKNIGVMIVLEGVYPNLNINKVFEFESQIRDTPRYIINYINLNRIINQPDIDVFEDFLIWRTQKDMPLYCFDEPDYWAFFEKYIKEKEIRDTFNEAKTKGIKMIFNSARFNIKKHSELIGKPELSSWKVL